MVEISEEDICSLGVSQPKPSLTIPEKMEFQNGKQTEEGSLTPTSERTADTSFSTQEIVLKALGN